jgi:hypothetical protein
VAEWSNVPDSKSGVPQGTVGSNPTLSAKTKPQVIDSLGVFWFLGLPEKLTPPYAHQSEKSSESLAGDHIGN